MPSVDVIGSHLPRDTRKEAGQLGDRHPDAVYSKNLLHQYSSSQSTWATDGQNSKDYYDNLQYKEELIELLGQRGQAAIPINAVTPATEMAVAILTARNPQWQATGREDTDRKAADLRSDLATYIWQQNRATEIVKEMCFDTYIYGRGVWQVYIDPYADHGKGEIKYRTVDPLSVYPDPHSQDRYWRDASNILTYNIYTRETLENMWPESRELLAQVTQTSEIYKENQYRPSRQNFTTQEYYTPGIISDTHHERYEVIERYTKVRMPYFRVYEVPTGKEYIFLEEEFQQYLQEPAFIMMMENDQQYLLDNRDVENAMMLWQVAEKIDEKTAYIPAETRMLPTGEEVEIPEYYLVLVTNEWMITNQIIEVAETLVPRIKYVVTISDELFINTYLPIENYPIIPFHTRHFRDPYPASDIAYVRPMQDMLNKLWSKSLANIASATNVKLVYPRGTVSKEVIESDLSRSGAAAIEFDWEPGQPQPQIIQPMPLPPTIEAKMADLINSIEKILGVYSVMQGDPQGAHPTHKGIMALNELGQQRIASKQKDLEGFLNQLGKVVIEMMPFVYQQRRVIRITQSSGTIKESVINDWMPSDQQEDVEKWDDITVGKYDLAIVSGSMLPTNRMAEAEFYKELFLHTAQAGFPIAESMLVMMLRKLDVPDLDVMLEKAGLINSQQQQIAQAQETIKKLEGDLQTMEREAQHSRMRTELEKFKASLSANDTAMRQGAQLHEARLNDMMQMEKERLTMERKLQLEKERASVTSKS